MNLTEEDFRVLQHAVERGEKGITVSIFHSSSMPRCRRLAEAGLLEHKAASMDTEWFGIADKGREALAKR